MYRSGSFQVGFGGVKALRTSPLIVYARKPEKVVREIKVETGAESRRENEATFDDTERKRATEKTRRMEQGSIRRREDRPSKNYRFFVAAFFLAGAFFFEGAFFLAGDFFLAGAFFFVAKTLTPFLDECDVAAAVIAHREYSGERVNNHSRARV